VTIAESAPARHRQPPPSAHTGGPSLAQERRIRTEVPGPRSRELHARRTAAVAGGVGSVLPVYVAAAGAV
jgi:4-aminobutyrate aminotransferase/(S)-3-amino-2-methylpropionate transaminase